MEKKIVFSQSDVIYTLIGAFILTGVLAIFTQF